MSIRARILLGLSIAGVPIVGAIAIMQHLAPAFTAATLIAGGALFVLAAWGIVLRVVIRLLGQIRLHINFIDSNEALPTRLDIQRGDEIGALADEVERLIRRDADSRALILQVSHQAGTAQVATEVLNNVENTLSSIDGAAEGLLDRAKSSNTAGLSRAIQMLRAHQYDLADYLLKDAKGPKLVEYLSELSALLSTEQGQAINELYVLRRSIKHAAEIIRLQQDYATTGMLFQQEDVTAILEDVLTMHAEAFARQGVMLERELDPLPRVLVQKARLMQVFTNLMRNTLEAFAQQAALSECAAKPNPRLTVRAHAREAGGVIIELSDNSVGIAPDNLAHIFQSGFTTKANGHGIGLRFCADAISAMDGRISVASKGIDCGATFTIELGINSHAELGSLPLPAARPLVRAA